MIYSDFYIDFFTCKKWKNAPENVKKLNLKKMSLFIQLYIARVGFGSGSGENFSDPTEKVRISNSGEISSLFGDDS